MRSGIITTPLVQFAPVADANAIIGNVQPGGIAYQSDETLRVKENDRDFVRLLDGDIPPARRNGSQWYNHSGYGVVNRTTGGLTANSLRFFPFFLVDYITFDTLRVNVSTLNTGTFKIGIYSNKPNDTYPDQRVLQALDIDATVANTKVISYSQQTLTKGLYWLAYHASNTPSLVSVPITAIPPVLGYNANFANNQAITGLFGTITYVAGTDLPAVAPLVSGLLANIVAPMIQLNSL